MSQEILFTTQIKQDGNMFVAYSPEFDVSSCGHSVSEASKNLKDAMIGFLESARERGVLREILEEAGYSVGETGNHQLHAPKFFMFEDTMIPLQYA
ncbi:MAG: hypothetical protein A3C00_01620 [Candidatus Jacksonbacteria bacterium RIFCSPHIGHO2_02_FULL_44_25]|nr:MAG: hypothetical protein A3C00_01620 [Candidatus Jacksonbacteria bacterium RIFCSPHIGHO2_02_FULL_44_25]